MLTKSAILARLGKICLALPDAEETVTFGHPIFRVERKTFSVFEEYKGELGICVKVEQELQGFFSTILDFFVRVTRGNMAG
jgi:predicted DNA-binding protein (MmcQ/YjbR family)